MRISSLLLLVNGIIASSKGVAEGDPFFIAAGICSLISNTLMAFFVRKNDYNVNAAKQDAPEAKPKPQPKISQGSAAKLFPPSRDMAFA